MSENPTNSRVYWRMRRGMLELDVLLQRFYQAKYASLTPELKQQYALLLEESDPQLYRWLIGSESANGHPLNDIVAEIIN